MTRTTRIEEEPEKFIERKIIAGLIGNTDYTREILKICDPVQLIESPTAKLLAGWCIEHFKKWDESPNRKIDDICFTKLKEKKVSDVLFSELQEEFLDRLNKEYGQKGVDKYLLDQTITYFRERQATILAEQLQTLAEAGDLNTFNSLRSEFKPISSTILEKEINAAELYEMEIPPPSWLINELLPKGFTIFGGRAKLGKSFLMLNIAMHLVQNKWMFADESGEGFKGLPGAILYLSLEDMDDLFQERIRNIDPTPDLNLLSNLVPKFKWDKLNNGGITAIEQWINEKRREKKRPRLIVIDVLAKVWDMKTGTHGGRQYVEDYNIYGQLSDLAHKNNISVIAITHTIKGKAVDPFDEILGGMGMQGSADNLMLLSRTKDGKIQLSVRGKRMAEKHLLFDVSNEGANWYCLGDANEVQKTDQRQSIYRYLNVNGPSTYKEIKQAAVDKDIEVSSNSVARILGAMVMDEVLEHNGRNGCYAIKGAGEKRTNMGIADRLNKEKTD